MLSKDNEQWQLNKIIYMIQGINQFNYIININQFNYIININQFNYIML